GYRAQSGYGHSRSERRRRRNHARARGGRAQSVSRRCGAARRRRLRIEGHDQHPRGRQGLQVRAQDPPVPGPAHCQRISLIRDLMTTYKAPLADMRFVLFDVLKLDAQYARIDGGANATRDVVDAILDEAAKFAETVLAPLNATGDEQGCVLDKATASVTTPKGFKEAYSQYVSGGWNGLTAPEQYGG